jgi:heptosyltransferase-2
MARPDPTRGNPDGTKPRPDAPATQAEPERVLVILPKGVGDVVLATPALRALRQRYPRAHFSFLVRSHLAPILAGGDWMDEVLHWPAGKGKSRPRRHRSFVGFAGVLRDHRFDWVVLLTNSFRSALLTRLAGIPRRIGYDRDGRGLLLTDRLLAHKANGRFVPISMIRYYNAVSRYLGCRECPTQTELFTTADEEAALDQSLATAGMTAGEPYIVLNPAASFGPAKCWLPSRFADVADRVADQTGAAVVISCGPREEHVARSVARHMRHRAVVLDKPILPLGPSKALVRRSILLITNDTGPRHFANAFGTAVVTIFGPTHAEWTANDYPNERTCAVQVDCGPCMKRRCPLDHRCMTGITSEMVVAQAGELLSGGLEARSKK